MAEHTSLACPRCHNRALESCACGTYELDLCVACRGMWCEATDWDAAGLGTPPGKAGDQPSSEGAIEFFQPDASEVFRSPDWTCPACQARLQVWGVRQVKGLTVDVCDGCGGVWFDSGEWQYLEAARDYQKQRPDIDRPTTWGEWLFQLLSELPVEFNVKPRRLPIMTLAIITTCCVLLLALPERMYAELALLPGPIPPDQLYRFVTHLFLHDGWLHLLGNMYMLYILGDNVEDVLGPIWFLFLYLCCGVIGGVAYLMLTAAPLLPLIRASGAVAGMIGAYLVMFRRSRLTFMLIVKQFKPPAVVWISFWLLIQMLAAWFDRQSMLGIAWFAHLGGFFSGTLLMLPWQRRLIARYPLLYLLNSRRINA